MGKSKKDKKDKKEKSKKRRREDSDSDDSDGAQVVVPEQISSSDYFRMNTPYTVWLKKKKGVFFDQLDSGKARKMFEKFVSKWNNGELKQKYYDLSTHVPTAKERTGYKWGFAKTLDKKDKSDLEHLRGNVDRTSQSEVLGNGTGLGLSETGKAAAAAVIAKKKKLQGPVMPSRGELDAYSAQLRQKDRRDYRKEKEVALDEVLGGKATGFEAKIQKRMNARQERLAREASPDIPAGNPYGDDSLKAAIAKRDAYMKEKQAKKQEAAKTKLEEYRVKEKEKMAALMEMAKVGRASNALYQPSN